jgi:hypothetical protein
LRSSLYSDNEGLVYRGLQVEELEQFLAHYAVGTKIPFPAFTSEAFKESSAYNGNVLFTIRSLTARAIWYLAASFDYHQHEILIPAGRSFDVVAVQQSSGRAVIVLEQP